MSNMIEVDADEYVALCASHLRLRDKILELCKQCAACSGTGMITVGDEWEAAFGKALPCDVCEDLRELL